MLLQTYPSLTSDLVDKNNTVPLTQQIKYIPNAEHAGNFVKGIWDYPLALSSIGLQSKSALFL